MSNNDIKRAYDQVADHFNLTRQKALPSQLIQFKQYLANGQRILDLGCGSGRIIRVLKDFEIDCVFTDISEKQLNYARKEDRGKIKSAEFIVQDILDSSFPKNKFDVIFCIATFHHLKTRKDRIKFLKNVYSWLKPDGYFLMTNWNLWQKKYLAYRNIWKGLGNFMVPYKNNDGQVLAQRFYHSFTHQELKKLLIKIGFRIEKIDLSESGNDIISVCRK
jgi:ubiquinone/menaquinone biosynthesis C-methylase UbiE